MVTQPKFKFIAGTLCLDFVNTAGGWVDSQVVNDKLAGFGDLVRWSELAGVLSPAESLKSTSHAEGGVFERALALRRALYRICQACLEGGTPPKAAGDVLNRELATARMHERVHFSPGKVAWTWDEPSAPDRILWSIVRAAAGFLTSPESASLRQCPGDECGWMFLDTSRNRSRQWCEMRICGNRAKIRRFRQRLRM
jgi:predicted RNA-binding Zn ribbon-like protein